MAMNLKGRHFLKMVDFSVEEINYLLDLSRELKADKTRKVEKKTMEGKNIVLLFQKDSTRTRSAFEVGAMDQGAGVTYFGPSGSHFGVKESVADSARVLSRIYDGIQFRGFAQEEVEELAANSHVPVWNGLTDEWHPTQMLADFLTMQEVLDRSDLRGVKFTYLGDAKNNMANSYLIMSAKMGLDFRIAGPAGLEPNKEVVKMAEQIIKDEQTGGKITVTSDPVEAVKGAHFITTDVWISMGEDVDPRDRIAALVPYQINSDLVKHADADYVFLHCLPAYHDDKTEKGKEMIEKYGKEFPQIKNGLEVTNDVFEDKNHSRVFEEAENRLHTIKAVMVATIGNI